MIILVFYSIFFHLPSPSDITVPKDAVIEPRMISIKYMPQSREKGLVYSVLQPFENIKK